VEENFQSEHAIHRCFSLARSFSAQTLIIEHIPALGLISQENGELIQMGFSPDLNKLLRLSFWKSVVPDENSIRNLDDGGLIGYAILKCDPTPAGKAFENRWYVFEAIFRKYEHSHNCVPGKVGYQVRIGEKQFTIDGVLYCQQNGLNKACAHVALRSLLSRLVKDRDISYTDMNLIAAPLAGSTFDPGDGLSVLQMQAILRHFKVAFKDIDYEQAEINNADVRATQPYQKYLYAGVESGGGGLLGFKLNGPMAPDGYHIVPFYGHTFNKDTWVPDAQASYFNIGGKVGYIPSESWTSSFIGHDDNFGANFCVPRLFVRPEHVQYVVEITKNGVAYSGIVAEAQALNFLYSLYDYMDSNSLWQKRLAFYSRPSVQKVVLRAVSVTREQYLTHLQTIFDWDGNQEDKGVLSDLAGLLPLMLWVVEVSLLHLFPANERKLGDIVLDATRVPNSEIEMDLGLFVLARLPGQYCLNSGTANKDPDFAVFPSSLLSHVELMRH